MALRNIIFSDNPNLRKKAKPVTEFNESLRMLLGDMRETMRANKGCGLAAPQVGILKRVIIVEVNKLFFEMVNPEIISQKGEQRVLEGCLSVKEKCGYVNRPMSVTVKGFDRRGNEYVITANDYLATAFCHEIDHLDGVLFTDKIVEEYIPPKKETK